MDNTRLQINKTLGIMSIIGAAIFPLAIWFIAAAVAGDVINQIDNIFAGGPVTPVSRPFIAWVFDLYAVTIVGIAIYALVQSKKVGQRLTGQILAIIAGAYFVIIPILSGTVAMILLIIAAVKLLKKNPDMVVLATGQTTVNTTAQTTTPVAEPVTTTVEEEVVPVEVVTETEPTE